MERERGWKGTKRNDWTSSVESNVVGWTNKRWNEENGWTTTKVESNVQRRESKSVALARTQRGGLADTAVCHGYETPRRTRHIPSKPWGIRHRRPKRVRTQPWQRRVPREVALWLVVPRFSTYTLDTRTSFATPRRATPPPLPDYHLWRWPESGESLVWSRDGRSLSIITVNFGICLLSEDEDDRKKLRRIFARFFMDTREYVS